MKKITVLEQYVRKQQLKTFNNYYFGNTTNQKALHNWIWRYPIQIPLMFVQCEHVYICN